MKKNRTFVVADIHGEYQQFKDLLELINFDYEKDTLIQLGDVVDRGLYTYECVEELLKIKNLIPIRGNHDDCWFSYLKGNENILWDQGGEQTYMSYKRNHVSPSVHFDFFKNQKEYYVDDKNNLFIHGGFNRHELLKDQNPEIFYWDRDLFLAAMSYESMKNNEYPFKIKENFKHIYIGHTPTIHFDKPIPITAANITNLDTGCGKGDYPLTAINLYTKEIFQTYKKYDAITEN